MKTPTGGQLDEEGDRDRIVHAANATTARRRGAMSKILRDEVVLPRVERHSYTNGSWLLRDSRRANRAAWLVRRAGPTEIRGISMLNTLFVSLMMLQSATAPVPKVVDTPAIECEIAPDSNTTGEKPRIGH